MDKGWRNPAILRNIKGTFFEFSGNYKRMVRALFLPDGIRYIVCRPEKIGAILFVILTSVD